MTLTPTIAVHLTAALGALVLGPWVLWARLGRTQHPRLHRTLGMTWVALMLVTALSAVFIRDFSLPNLAGYTPIHLLVPVSLITLFVAFRQLYRGHVRSHRIAMVNLYFGACVTAGLFTLLPNRLLGGWLWGGLGLL